MKKLLTFLLIAVIGIPLLAQSPESFNYQAVIKNAQGGVVANQNVSMQIGILQGSASGTNVYTETHLAETNSYGLVSLQIGEGNVVSGNFASIDWGNDLFFIQIEVDITGGTSYTEIGTMQLASVPYALYATDVLNKDDADADPSNELQTLGLSGANLSITDGNSITLPDADDSNEIQTLGISGANLSITNGNSVTLPDADDSNELQTLGLSGASLSITNGNSITLPDADDSNELQTLGLSGNTLSITDGNSVSLSNYVSPWQTLGDDIYFNTGNVGIGITSPQATLEVKAAASANINDPLLQVINKTGDTVFAVYDGGVKISFDENAKGNIGGFAVSGRTTSKGDRDYFTVSKDSTRVYVDQGTKGNIGGFAVSGRTTSKGTDAFLDLTPENYFIGHSSGSSISTGTKNTFFGFEAGKSNSTGNSNIFIGNLAGTSNYAGHWNVFIGHESGQMNKIADYNTFIGYQSGKNNNVSGGNSPDGCENVFIGYKAGINNDDGFRNVFLGTNAGIGNTSGFSNIFIGREAGVSNTSGSSNIYIGAGSGDASPDGSNNTFVGRGTGANQTSGGYNVYIGSQAAIYKASGDRNVQIGYHSGSRAAGDDNVLIGYQSGGGSEIGSSNVAIGKQAGGDLSAGESNKLYIENSDADRFNALIYGEFDNDFLRINGRLEVYEDNFRIAINPGTATTPVYYAYQGASNSTLQQYAFAIHDALWVSTNAFIDGTITSSKSLQKSAPDGEKLANIDLNANDLFSISTYKYTTKETVTNEDTKVQKEIATQDIGISATELEEQFPALVETNESGEKYINYAKLSVVLLEALKEQNKEMKKLKEFDAEIMKRLETLENK